MLGDQEPRNYLVLIQNSAEIRATGGIPGALAIITADDGGISLTSQASSSDIDLFEPALETDSQQEAIYSFRMGAYIQSVNLTPDFPTAAATAKEMWEQRRGGPPIDGVIAIDPVVLSNILRATGPVDLGDFANPAVSSAVSDASLPSSLTSENVLSTLLSAVYAQVKEPVVQDAYFAAVAARIFEAIAAGQGDSGQLIRALITSAEQDRLYLWSSLDAEQNLIATSRLSGEVTGASVGGTSFGVYFNDGTGAKMDYYTRRTVQLQQHCNNEEGYSEYTVRVSLTNTAPIDAGNVLPPYVTGGGIYGVAPGNVRTNTIAYGPTQALLQSARIDGENVPLGAFLHGQRPVGVLTTEIGPGETATIEMDFSQVVQESEPFLKVTPTIQDNSEVRLPAELCR
ncbi:hypothetical protein DDA93_15295 [Arthrobacter sp. Bz4]|nr:hypothetical protein DDA93_15295 [Arthrobacter sp. Bz4]